MILLNLWSVKARDEIRGIAFGDVNNDGENEIVFASWDGKIQVIKSSNGEKIWVPIIKDVEGPAENVVTVQNTSDGPMILASIHKHIVALDAINRETLWYSTLDGWINNLRKVDIDDDGEDEIIASTLSGSTFGIDTNGEKLWVRKGVQLVSPYTLDIVDINLDGSSEVIKIGKKFDSIEILSSDGGLIRTFKVKSPVLAITHGKVLMDFPESVIFSLENGFGIILDGKPIIKTFKKPFKPYCLGVIDIDNDDNKEIVLGDWLSNSAMVYKIDSEKYTFKKLKEFKLNGNPMIIESIDLQGDGKESLIVGTKTKLGENEKVYIFSSSINGYKYIYNSRWRYCTCTSYPGYGTCTYKQFLCRIGLFLYRSRY